jgi:SPOR domain
VAPTPEPAPVFVRQQREVRIASERRSARRHTQALRRQPVAKPATAKAVTERKALEFSNPWESAEASGRMVRVGTYSSLKQGKQAWSRLANVYPAMKKLPAVVTDLPSLRNGRVYYRLQIGTTSQAHSEVLCQRMKAIGQSCVVVDLAGARKGSGDERQPVGV